MSDEFFYPWPEPRIKSRPPMDTRWWPADDDHAGYPFNDNAFPMPPRAE